jgi:hypothetical protein
MFANASSQSRTAGLRSASRWPRAAGSRPRGGPRAARPRARR